MMADKPVPSWSELQQAAVALLHALGVLDTSEIVSFTLHYDCHEWPRLTIVRLANLEMGDKTTLAAAGLLAPGVQIVEEAAAP